MEQLALAALPHEEVDEDEGLASDDADSLETASKASTYITSAVAQQSQNLGVEPTPEDLDEREEAIDENEPRYCYCNQVSYGEMIGCDYPGCQREWFHFECTGLKVLPLTRGIFFYLWCVIEGELCI